MGLRFTRSRTLGGRARKLLLAGLIGTLAIAGVATATLAGASTRQSSKSSSSSSVTWRATSVTAPGSSGSTQLLGISDSGMMTGYSGTNSSSRGFWINGSTTRSSSWGWFSVPGSVQTQVVAVSANGTIVVGFFVTRTGANYGFVRWHGQWWSVAYPGSSGRNSYNQLTSVNNNGIATGFYRDSSGRTRSYLYNIRTHVFILIVVPMATTTVIVTAINNTGTIVGFVVTRRTTVAFVIRNRVFIILAFGSRTNTRAWGINSSGTVVGSFVGTNGMTHGFMWTSTGMHQIDSPWSSRTTVITAVNNRGQAVGFFTDARGRMHGIVIVFIIVQATNFSWNWGGMSTVPMPSGTMMPSSAASSMAMAGSTSTGTSSGSTGTSTGTTGGTGAVSGHHF